MTNMTWKLRTVGVFELLSPQLRALLVPDSYISSGQLVTNDDCLAIEITISATGMCRWM